MSLRKPNRALMLLAFALITTMSVSPAAFAAKERPSLGAVDNPFDHVDGSGPYRKSAELVRHAVNQKRLAAQAAAMPAVESVDVGDVAVIVDNGSILIPPKPAIPFDLSVPTALSWVPPVTTTQTSGKGGKGKKVVETQSASSDSFTVAFSSATLDPSFGADLGLGDDDATDLPVAEFSFPFLGASYGGAGDPLIFVGSDGHITFGVAEASSSARDAGRHIGGPPRVSPFFTDLDPTCAGSVHADVRADRIVVTWSGVPPFAGTCTGSPANTFQAVLHESGDIDFVFDDINLPFAVVGVAGGADDEGPINPIDLSADLPGTFGAGAIFEEFSPAIIIQQMDVVQLAKEFYNTHDDKFDFLVMFSDPIVDIGGGAFAFHAGLHRENQGLGFFRGNNTIDNCGLVGLPAGCELESLLNMNRIGLYWPEADKLVDPPIKKFRFFCFNPGGQIVPCAASGGFDGSIPPGEDQLSLRARRMGTLNGDFGAFGSYTLGLNSAMSIMAQEAGHRWLAFPAFLHPGGFLSADLLGRDFAHWSFFHNVTVPSVQFEDQDGDPRASSAEGNAITDLGPNPTCDDLGKSGLFQNQPNELVDGFTKLDQYFIGLRRADEVGPFWYVDNPTVIFGGNPSRSTAPRDDVLVCGDRIDLSVDDITIAGLFLGPSNGPRDPVIGDEQDAGPGIGATDDAKCTDDRECVDVKTMAFILLVTDDPSLRQSTIQQVDDFRATWESYGNGPAVGGLGARGTVGDTDYIPKFDTSLDPEIH